MRNGVVDIQDRIGRLLGVIAGNVAAGVADSGNPIKIGGVYNAAPPTLLTGQRGDVQLDAYGNLKTTLLGRNDGTPGSDGNGQIVSVAKDSDGTVRPLIVAGNLYNGASWDRARTPNVFKAVGGVAVVAGTPVTIWTPAAGKKFRLMGYFLSGDAATAAIFLDQAAEVIRTGKMAAGIGVPSPAMGNGALSAVANNVLKLDTLVNTSFHGYVFGTEE